MTYYALSDNQNGGELLHTGRNATSLAEIKDALLSFVENDIDADDLAYMATQDASEVAAMLDFTIITNETPYGEE